MTNQPEFSGLKGRFFAWFLTSPLRRILHAKMGDPDGRFLELLDLRGHEVVVDAGCGSGHHTLMVAERLVDGRVLAIDVSREMIDKLRRNASARDLDQRIEAIVGDALAIPAGDQSVDCAIALAAWHHFDDPQAACNELARVLRPGGRAVVVDLEVSARSKPGEDMHVAGHSRAFDMPDMRRIFEGAGLDVHTVERLGRWIVGAAVKPGARP